MTMPLPEITLVILLFVLQVFVFLCVLEMAYMQNLGLASVSAGKESACTAGDLGSIPGLGRSLGEGKDYPLQCSGLEKSMDCIVHGVAKSWTRLSDLHFHFTLSGRCSAPVCL